MDTSIDPALLASMIEALALAWLPKTAEDPVAAAHTALAAMQPRDLIEAMLAARMIAAHHASIDSFGRAMLPGLGDGDASRRGPAGVRPRPRCVRPRKMRSPATGHCGP
jgi:hypothetical protein